MKIVEFRIPLPLTLEQYHICQIYMVAQASLEATTMSDGVDGVRCLVNKPYDDPKLGRSFYTHKRISIAGKLPPWLASMVKPEWLTFDEKSWNAFPRLKTEYYVSMHFTVDSMHHEGAYTEPNPLNLTQEQITIRSIINIDIANDPISIKDYNSLEDPKLFRSETCGFEPLSPSWLTSITPIMTCYKVFFIDIPLGWGLTSQVENWIINTMRSVIHMHHRRAICWMDRWYRMSINEARKMETEVSEQLNKIWGDRTNGQISNSTTKSNNLQEFCRSSSGVETLCKKRNIVNENCENRVDPSDAFAKPSELACNQSQQSSICSIVASKPTEQTLVVATSLQSSDDDLAKENYKRASASRPLERAINISSSLLQVIPLSKIYGKRRVCFVQHTLFDALRVCKSHEGNKRLAARRKKHYKKVIKGISKIDISDGASEKTRRSLETINKKHLPQYGLIPGTHAGFLYKLNEKYLGASWSRCYVVLSEKQLKYYEDPKDLVSARVMDLTNASVTWCGELILDKSHSIAITPASSNRQKNKLYFRGENEEETKLWMLLLQVASTVVPLSTVAPIIVHPAEFFPGLLSSPKPVYEHESNANPINSTPKSSERQQYGNMLQSQSMSGLGAHIKNDCAAMPQVPSEHTRTSSHTASMSERKISALSSLSSSSSSPLSLSLLSSSSSSSSGSLNKKNYEAYCKRNEKVVSANFKPDEEQHRKSENNFLFLNMPIVQEIFNELAVLASLNGTPPDLSSRYSVIGTFEGIDTAVRDVERWSFFSTRLRGDGVSRICNAAVFDRILITLEAFLNVILFFITNLILSPIAPANLFPKYIKGSSSKYLAINAFKKLMLNFTTNITELVVSTLLLVLLFFASFHFFQIGLGIKTAYVWTCYLLLNATMVGFPYCLMFLFMICWAIAGSRFVSMYPTATHYTSEGMKQEVNTSSSKINSSSLFSSLQYVCSGTTVLANVSMTTAFQILIKKSLFNELPPVASSLNTSEALQSSNNSSLLSNDTCVFDATENFTITKRGHARYFSRIVKLPSSPVVQECNLDPFDTYLMSLCAKLKPNVVEGRLWQGTELWGVLSDGSIFILAFSSEDSVAVFNNSLKKKVTKRNLPSSNLCTFGESKFSTQLISTKEMETENHTNKDLHKNMQYLSLVMPSPATLAPYYDDCKKQKCLSKISRDHKGKPPESEIERCKRARNKDKDKLDTNTNLSSISPFVSRENLEDEDDYKQLPYQQRHFADLLLRRCESIVARQLLLCNKIHGDDFSNTLGNITYYNNHNLLPITGVQCWLVSPLNAAGSSCTVRHLLGFNFEPPSYRYFPESLLGSRLHRASTLYCVPTNRLVPSTVIAEAAMLQNLLQPLTQLRYLCQNHFLPSIPRVVLANNTAMLSDNIHGIEKKANNANDGFSKSFYGKSTYVKKDSRNDNSESCSSVKYISAVSTSLSGELEQPRRFSSVSGD